MNTRKVISNLRKAIKSFQDGKGVDTIVAVVIDKSGNNEQQFVLGLEGHEFETIGCLEIVKRDILNQVPEVQRGDL